MDELKKQFTSVNLLVALLIIAVGIYLLQLLWQVLGIFSDAIVVVFLAWVVSFILEPAVDRLTSISKFPKLVSAGIVYAICFGLLALVINLFIPVVNQQFQVFGRTFPNYLATSPQFIHRFVDTGYTYLESSIGLLPSVASFLLSVFIILIISFYLVIDRQHIQKEIYNLIPRKWHHHALFTQELIDTTFGSFLRVQLLTGIIAGLATWAVLQVVGNPFALSIGLLSGILTIIPFVGAILGIIPPVAITFFTDPTQGILVFIILLIMQQILFNVIFPKLLGNALKLHPIVVLLSFIVGFKLFGPLGAVFGVPILAILTVILHRLGNHFIFLERD